MRHHYARGLTLIEILVVVVILAIISIFSINALMASGNTQALDKDVKGIIAVLDQARSNTLTSQGNSQYGVHFEADKVVLFKGTTYSSSDSNNRDAGLSGQTTLSSISLSGGAVNVVFARLTGKPNVTGTITVQSERQSTLTKTITIYATGISEEN